MNKEVISDKQGIVLVVLFIMGSSLVIGGGAEAKQDVWIAVIVGMLSAIPILLMYARILYLFPGKDMFDIVNVIFGKIIGKGISLLYIWFAFHLGVLVLRNFGCFIQSVGLRNTPMIITLASIGFLSMWGIKEGIEVLGRWSEFFLPIILSLIIITLLLGISDMELSNLKPVLYDGFKPMMKGAFSFLTFPFAETIIFTMIFSNMKSKKSVYKIYMVGLLIGGGVLLLITLVEILILGSNIYSVIYAPFYFMVGRINVLNFIQRIEIIVSISFIIGGFIKVSVSLLAACRGITKVFGYKDYRFIVVPISLLMIILSYSIYNNVDDMARWAFEIWRYYAVPFQMILPILIFIGAEIKTRKNNKKSTKI